MKKIAVLVAVVFFASVVSGCVVSGPRVGPPAPRSEVVSAKPGPNFVWVGGHWHWNGQKYVWASGQWVKPRAGKTWVPGHWEKRGPRWVWKKGHWR